MVLLFVGGAHELLWGTVTDAGFRAVQEVSVTYGEKYCITLINSNADAHVFHLHGHVFTTVETTVGRGQLGVWRDSVLVPGGNCARRTLCFKADNAAGGYWVSLSCPCSGHCQ